MIKKGVSLVALVATITIIVILISTVIIAGNNMLNNVKNVNFLKEINFIQERVNEYINNSNNYPILNNVVIDISNVSEENKAQLTNNGEKILSNTVSLYEIDYEKIGYNNLKYGNKSSGTNDIYVMSAITGKVYYAKGFKVGSEVIYASTTNPIKSTSSEKAYIQDGLILHYDGINNTGNGHSSTTTTWKDLSGNDNDGVIHNNTNKYWNDNSFNSRNNIVEINNIVYELDNWSIELTFEPQNPNDWGGLISFDNKEDVLNKNFRIEKNDMPTNYNIVSRETFNSYGARLPHNALQTNLTNFENKISNKLTVTFDNNVMMFYKNNELVKKLDVIKNSYVNTICICARSYTNDGNIIHNLQANIYSVRIYNKTLNDEEIKHNYEIDKERFFGEEKVKNRTINGNKPTYNNPIIPVGFKPLETTDASWEDANNDGSPDGWNDGLVIQDENGNEFVWVPVDGVDVKYEKWCTSGIAWNNLNLSDVSNELPSGVDENTQIKNYGGFYIGRYESGTPDGNELTRTNSVGIPLIQKGKTVWSNIDYNNANASAKLLYNNTNVKSGLLTGTMWDTVCKWISNSGIDVSDSRTWGNHSNSIAPANVDGYGSRKRTGYSEYWKAKNIYDLAGNVWEWTNEAYSTERFFRGGNFYNGGRNMPIRYRYNSNINNTYGGVGFRIALYIK